MSILNDPQQGVIAGPVVGLGASLAANENGIYLPATIDESIAIGGTLDVIWNLQDASSPLADIPDAALDMVATGTLGYNAAISGWDRTFVNLPEVANNRLSFGAAMAASSQSFVFMFLGRINTVGASGRRILNAGTSGVLLIRVNSNGTLNTNINTVQDNGSFDYVTDGTVRMFSIEWDRRASGSVRVRTTDEVFAGTFGAAGDQSSCHIGGSGGTLPPDMDIGWSGLALGTNAEALIDANPITVFTAP